MSQAASTTTGRIANVNPHTNQVVREFPPVSAEAIDHAVEMAHHAFHAWRDQSREIGRGWLAGPSSCPRANRRGRAADHPRNGQVDRAQQGRAGPVRPDPGVPRGRRPAAPRGEPLDFDGGSAVVVNDPLGVLLGVQPWNFPAGSTTPPRPSRTCPSAASNVRATGGNCPTSASRSSPTRN